MTTRPGSVPAPRFDIARDPMIDAALAEHAPAYVGVSGGKDSQARKRAVIPPLKGLV